MTWLSLVNLLLKLAHGLVAWLAQRQLIDAGRALEANESLSAALEALEHAKEIDRTFDSLPAADRERLRQRHTRPG